MKKLLLFILSLSLVASAALAQKANFFVSADKQKIIIGEPFIITLQAAFPKGKKIAWTTVDTIPHFEILSRSVIDSLANGKEVLVKQTLTATSWDSGRWQLMVPPPAGYKNASKVVMMDVGYSSFDPTQDYHDVKDILEGKKPSRVTWYWYLIGAALLLALFALFFPKRKGEKQKPEPKGDPYKEAMAKLALLKSEEGGDVKAFYTELVNIFRAYVQQRKDIHSFQKTTDDLSVQLKKVALPSEEYNDLVQVLRLSDFVKFAKYTPSVAENEASLSQIKKSIIAIENIK